MHRRRGYALYPELSLLLTMPPVPQFKTKKSPISPDTRAGLELMISLGGIATLGTPVRPYY